MGAEQEYAADVTAGVGMTMNWCLDSASTLVAISSHRCPRVAIAKHRDKHSPDLFLFLSYFYTSS